MPKNLTYHEIIGGALSLVALVGVIVLAVLRLPIPPEVSLVLTVSIGYYFGAVNAAASNPTIPNRRQGQ